MTRLYTHFSILAQLARWLLSLAPTPQKINGATPSRKNMIVAQNLYFFKFQTGLAQIISLQHFCPPFFWISFNSWGAKDCQVLCLCLPWSSLKADPSLLEAGFFSLFFSPGGLDVFPVGERIHSTGLW